MEMISAKDSTFPIKTGFGARGKRSRLQIYHDILQHLHGKEDDEGITRVACKANMPLDRFRAYLDHLVQVGMISKRVNGELAVTDKGLEFIQEYERITVFLAGIEMPSEHNIFTSTCDEKLWKPYRSEKLLHQL